MAKKNISSLVRPNIMQLKAYRSARDEFQEGWQQNILLDANESPVLSSWNRYPDPYQKELKELISRRKGIPKEQLALGNGSDEVIDILIRIFCEPREEAILILPPTYGMYEVVAHIQDVRVLKVPLSADEFQPDAEEILRTAKSSCAKIIFLCSPNNPTGNVFLGSEVEKLLLSFNGIVCIDEAYSDFALVGSWADHVADFPNMVVMQTLSKAWGLAGLRLGLLIADPEIIGLYNKVKPPYNINQATQAYCQEAIKKGLDNTFLAKIREERERVRKGLSVFSSVKKIYPSDANFLLIQTTDEEALYKHLLASGIVVRRRGKEIHCSNCLRVTIGTVEENNALLVAWERYDKQLLPQKVSLPSTSFSSLPLREATVHRQTSETDIHVTVSLDNPQIHSIDTGLRFFDHMLDQISRHGNIGIEIQAKGDLEIDEHHTIEDTALTLGQAIREALGDKRGISRYGYCLPMDECISLLAIDFGGRPCLVWDTTFSREKVGDVPTEMFKHFFKSFCDAAAANLHVIARGENEHHKIEGIFKAFARALRMAVHRSGDSFELPSTKGLL